MTELILVAVIAALLIERTVARHFDAKERRRYTAAILARSPFEFQQLDREPQAEREPREPVGQPEGL